MTVTRYQRRIEKLQSIQASKRYAAAQLQSSAPKEEKIEVGVSTDFAVVETKTTEETLETSPVAEDSAKQEKGIALSGTVVHAEEKEIENSAADENVAPALVEEEDKVHSPARLRKFPVPHGTPKSRNMARIDELKESTPPRRFDIANDETVQPDERKASKAKEASVKRSSRGKKSRKKRRSKRVRINEGNNVESDASSVDSQLESFLSDRKSDGIAGALDHVFDFFGEMDDMRSVDSMSLRSERTDDESYRYRYGHAPPFKPKVDIVKELEEFFVDRFSCGPAIPECKDMGTPTFSDAEDDETATLSEGKDHRYSASGRKRPSKSRKTTSHRELDVMSESADLSTIPHEEDTETATLTTKESAAFDGSQANSTYLSEKDITQVPSFETRDADWDNICNLARYLDEQPEDSHRSRKKSKLRDLLDNAKRRAKEFDTSTIFSSSFKESMASTSFRDTTTGDVNTVTDTVTAFTTGTGANTVETQSVVQQNPEGAERASPSEPETDKEECKDEPNPDVYAPAPSIKPSASFFSVDTRQLRKQNDTETTFQKVMARLRDDTALASQRMLEFQASLGINLGSDPDAISDRLKELLTCGTPKADQEHGSEVSMAEKIKSVLTCTPLIREDSVVAKVDPKVLDDPKEAAAADEDVTTIVVAEAPEQKTTAVNDSTADAEKATEATDLETRSVQTKETSNSSSEEEREERPEDSFLSTEGFLVHEIENLTPETSQEEIPLPENDEKKGKKKRWSKLRRVSKLMKPLFRSKKDKTKETTEQASTESKTEMETFYSESVFNTSVDHDDSCMKSFVSLASTSQQNASTASNPFDPALSAKAKREAWRSTQVDEFDEIISTNARDTDWDPIFPQLVTNEDGLTKASF